MNKTLITLSGPTACGKTDLSIRIAKTLGAEIFSCDSRQFYKEMSIGTAVPSETELKEIPHHFIQHKSIQSPYSVGQFETDAMDALTQYFEKQDFAILVGGSGLYMHAVVEGIDKFPEVPEEIRTALGQRLETNGLEELQQELQSLDPDHYQKIDIQNPSRVLRALGVSLAAGQPYSSFLGQDKPKRPFTVLPLTVDISRELLYNRINERVDQMINAGLLQEAESLYPYRDLNALQTVGYQEIFDFFDQKIDLDEAIAQIKQHTRNYAKRQMTWIRRKESNAEQINPTISDEDLVSILPKQP
ncbi:MAG: tRNA (adenosine(37)-N6)-dimethylallyltransferase MiaA [Flavobacteriaceae bacterium]|nr:tRNA (adenosine(37)-N6)-dimethylallyltransferase MiaA [Flavobacteriaceae bacterium]